MYTTDLRVILAGAGPGDPELLTIKAMRAIADAEVILYDALVSREILSYASPQCVMIDVGKRKDQHRFCQDEINRMILFYAQRFNKVLRLKGGDPYVFGRGSEELAYLKRNGVHALVIPGISSAIAGPAAAGIPVTQRGVSESFWVITGTAASGKLSRDIELAAKSSATVVVLMGLGKLSEIASMFRTHRSVDEPVAVVLDATLPQQHVITGTLASIEKKSSEITSASPGIIVIGKVVSAQSVTQILEQEHSKMKVAV